MDDAGFAELALGLPDAVAVIDASATVLWINTSAEVLFGLSRDEVVRTSALALVHPEDLESVVVAMTRVQRKTRGSLNEFRVRTSSGWRRVELIGSNLLDTPSVGGIVVSMRDLTERRRWEVATDQTERFRSLVHNARSVLMLLDDVGKIVSVSAAITRLLGQDQDLVEGMRLSELVADHDRGRFEVALSEASVDHSSSGGTVIEVDMLRRDHSTVPFELNIVNLLEDPTVEGFVVSAHEISELRAVRDALQHLATRDSLTGLPNRSLILERVDHMLARSRRLDAPSALLFIDLDCFKEVNDSLGHRVGDEVLRQVSGRFVSALRGSDAVGRLGGDEFVVLVEDASAPHDAEIVAARLLDSLRSPIPVTGKEGMGLTMSASIGVAMGQYTSGEELLADADMALYRAKAEGRNRFVHFDPSMERYGHLEFAVMSTDG